MNDLLEEDLRETYAERYANYDSTQAAERLRARDYRLRRRGRLWGVVGASGTALTGGIVTAIVLLSSTASEAFAGWTAVPTAPTPAALAAATAACNWMNAPDGPPVLTGTPVLTESRDKYTAAIFVTPSTGSYYECMSDGVRADTTVGNSQDLLTSDAAPGPDQLGVPDDSAGSAPGFPGSTAGYNGQAPSWWSALTGSNASAQRTQFLQGVSAAGIERNLVGLAGQDVQSVTFAFDQGVTVNATVENGWYFAWWPGMALPNSVQITTNSGTTTTSPVPWSTACTPTNNAGDSSCGVFATGQRPSAIRKLRAVRNARTHAG